MKLLSLTFAILASSASLPAQTLSQTDAQAIAEQALTDGGISLSDYVLVQTKHEPSGEWSFLYECKSRRADCQFLTVVNSETGGVRTTSEIATQSHKQMSARTVRALASRTREACDANGGIWVKEGFAQLESCDISAPDAGMACSDSTQCEHLCVADPQVQHGERPNGRCDEWHSRYGCINEVKDGIAIGGACVD